MATLSQTPNQILILILSLSSGKPLRMDQTNQYNRVSEFIWRRLVAQWFLAFAMLAGDPGSILGHATNFSNFSEGIGKPL